MELIGERREGRSTMMMSYALELARQGQTVLYVCPQEDQCEETHITLVKDMGGKSVRHRPFIVKHPDGDGMIEICVIKKSMYLGSCQTVVIDNYDYIEPSRRDEFDALLDACPRIHVVRCRDKELSVKLTVLKALQSAKENPVHPGTVLNKIRTSLQTSLDKWCEATGLSPVIVSEFERGLHMIDAQILSALCYAYGIETERHWIEIEDLWRKHRDGPDGFWKPRSGWYDPFV